LQKLNDFTKATSTAIRYGVIYQIKSGDLVIGKSRNVKETVTIYLIGIIVNSNDFSANESRLTEESFGVLKISRKKTATLTTGSAVASRLAIATVFHLGKSSCEKLAEA
jgi:Ca2+-transporting ATPase